MSLQVYRAHFWLFIGYSAWLLVPFTLYFILSFFPEDQSLVVLFAFLTSILEFVLTFWIGIILILLVNAVIEKHPFDAEGVKKYSATLLQPTARVFLLHLLFVVIGFILLIIPGFIALVLFAFAQTSTILDGKRGMEALKFSQSLSEGRFFRVLYRLIGGPIIIGFFYSFIVAFIVAIGGSSAGMSTSDLATTPELPGWLNLLQSTVEIFAIPLLATYMTLLYKHLKETRDPSTKQETIAQDDTKEAAQS